MKKLIIISVLQLLCACRGETYKSWSISNDSSEEITVQFSDATSNDQKSFTILSNKKQVINKTKINDLVKEEGNPSLALKGFQIKNSSGDTCTKDYTKISNWLILSEKKSPPSRKYISYILTVEDLDF